MDRSLSPAIRFWGFLFRMARKNYLARGMMRHKRILFSVSRFLDRRCQVSKGRIDLPCHFTLSVFWYVFGLDPIVSILQIILLIISTSNCLIIITIVMCTMSHSLRKRKTSSSMHTRRSGSKSDRAVPLVQHTYHDHARDSPTDGSMISETKKNNASKQAHAAAAAAAAHSFPVKLHQALERIEEDGLAHIISWQPHGRSFIIHQPPQFKDILPMYFPTISKVTSFQRQLNLYGFKRLTRLGPDKGCYYHECFLRRKVFLTARMRRTKVKGTGVRARSNPQAEPDFYAMETVQQALQEQSRGGQSKESSSTIHQRSTAPSSSSAAASVISLEDHEDDHQQEPDDHFLSSSTTRPRTPSVSSSSFSEEQDNHEEPYYHHDDDAPQRIMSDWGMPFFDLHYRSTADIVQLEVSSIIKETRSSYDKATWAAATTTPVVLLDMDHLLLNETALLDTY